MPVTAKLSKLFYERLGEQVADELVNWFNTIDDSYHRDLRELNELNFSRFDAKLEQRIAELHAKLAAKIDRVEAKLDAKIDWVVTKLDAKVDRIEFERAIATLDAKIDRRYADLLKWSFAFWASAVGILALLR